jgi:hypothetical protein
MAANQKGIDTQLMKNIKDHCRQLESDHHIRNQNFEEVELMFLMDWQEKKRGSLNDDSKITISPSGRNKALGMFRLMVATDPVFSIATEKATDAEAKNAEGTEKAIARAWDQAGRINGNPVHYDNILSSILYSEMHTAITLTSDLVEHSKKKEAGAEKPSARLARAQRVANQTPFLFEPWNPKTCFPEFDRLGLCAHYHYEDTTFGAIQADFPNLPDKVRNAKRYTKTKLHRFYDLDYTAVWCDAGDILLEEHGLPVIPVCVQLTEGSKLFPKPEDQRQMMLYTLMKSGLWKRENLALTVLYTLMFGIGANPLFIHTSPQGAPGKKLTLDFSIPGNTVELEYGEAFAPLIQKGVIDPSLVQGYEIAAQLTEESTIYSQALGQPVARDSTFSEISLLSQAGRLPLIGTQRRGSWGISNIIETSLQLYKANPSNCKGFELKASDISETLQVDTKLEVTLPQDKLQMANLAKILTDGENPVVDLDWARENIMNIGQPGKMQERIWSQQAAGAHFMDFLKEVIAMSQAGRGSQQPGANVPRPTAGPAMAPGQAQQIQGIPPQMAGMMPGMGQGQVPPGMEAMS